MVVIDFAILILATWRLTSFLVEEEGPFNIFCKFRHWIGIRYDEWSERYGTNVIASALTCVWCASVWVAIFLAIAYFIAGSLVVYVCLPFAISAGAIIIDEIANRSK